MNADYFKLVLNGNVRIAPKDKAMEVCGEMVSAFPPGIPSFTPCDENGNEIKEEEVKAVEVPVAASPALVAPILPPPMPSPVYSTWGSTVVDQDAKKRIEDMHAKLKAAGSNIDSKNQFFETGTRMAEEGYRTQANRKREHDQMAPAKDIINEFVSVIINESREDHNVSAKEVGDAIKVEGKDIFCFGHLFTERAILGLMQRLGSPASRYVLGLQERIGEEEGKYRGNKDFIAADINQLAEICRYECLRNANEKMKLRSRKNPNDIFCVVSNSYAVADAPIILDQILSRLPDSARGSYAYDPTSTSWEFRQQIFSDTETDKMSVGEVFSAHISMSSRDTGDGRFRGGGGINILRCLNASTYSADGTSGSRIHKGNAIYDIMSIIRNSTKAIHTLCDAWGRNRTTEVEVHKGLTLEQTLPGIYSFLLKEGELAKILVGRQKDHANGLARAYFSERRDEEKIVRSDLIQGWTKYIQGQPTSIRREAELAAGDWLVNNKKPIRYEVEE